MNRAALYSTLSANQLKVIALDINQGRLLQRIRSATKKRVSTIELAKQFRVSPQRLSNVLKDLALRGLVRLHSGQVEITEAGTDMLESAKRLPSSVAEFLAKRYELEALVSSFSAALASAAPSQLDAIIEKNMARVLKLTGVDRVCWYIQRSSTLTLNKVYSAQKPGVPSSPSAVNAADIPLTAQSLAEGQTLILRGAQDLPTDAEIDRRFFKRNLIGGLVLVPSDCGTQDRGVLGLAFPAPDRSWMPDLLDQLRVFNNLIVTAVERKSAHQMLEESEERFRCLFQDAPIGIALENTDGGLLFVNPALCSMLGYEEKELCRMRCSQFTYPEDEKKEFPLFQKLKSGVLNRYKLDKRFRRKDGSLMWGRVDVSLVKPLNGGPSLVVGMVEDITEIKHAEGELKTVQIELQQLTHRLIQVQDNERRLISRELHDDIGQRLAVLAVELDVLHNSLAGAGHDQAERQAFRLLADAQELMQDVHQLSHDLHSSKLQHLGLRAALIELCHSVSRLHHVTTDISEGDPHRLPPEVELCFYRVAQEGLNNIMKHSKAEQVFVRLKTSHQLARLEIQDTGVGFDNRSSFRGIGLASMRERLRMVGGSLIVTSSPGKGTQIRAEVPLRSAELSSNPAA